MIYQFCVSANGTGLTQLAEVGGETQKVHALVTEFPQSNMKTISDPFKNSKIKFH